MPVRSVGKVPVAHQFSSTSACVLKLGRRKSENGFLGGERMPMEMPCPMMSPLNAGICEPPSEEEREGEEEENAP
jgi:hypothetical protein